MGTADGTQVSPQNVTRPARLNPFAFPSDTDLRFVVLIVSILASSLFIYNLLSNFALIDVFKGSSLCFLHGKAIQAMKNTTNTQVLDAASYALWKCQVPFLIPHILLQTAGIVLILGVAAVIYWLIPLWILTRERLVPLSTKDAPEIVAYLSSLCNEAKLTPAPRFVWNPLNFISRSHTFGRLGRYYIALSGGLVTLFSTDQAAFRAIMLHELAHLRNRDVNKTFFAIAIWRAFVAVALVPFVIMLLLRYPQLIDPYQILRILILTVLVRLTRDGVLRAREVYADVRASTWESSPEALIRALKLLSPVRWWQKLTYTHPDPQERERMIHETHRLFRVDLWVAFSLGIAIGITFPNIEALLNDFFTLLVPVSIYNTFWHIGITSPELAALGTALVSASLLVGIVGVNIWRATFATLVQNRPQSGVGRISFCLGGGLIIGTFLSLSLENSVTKFSITEMFVSNLPWILLLLISLMLFLRWIAVGAEVWLDVAVRQGSPRLIYKTGLVIAGVVLTVWLTQLFLFRTYSLSSEDLANSSHVAPLTLLLNIILEPGSLFAFMSLWAFPLSTWFWPKGATATEQPSWVFLDTPFRCLNLPYQGSIRLSSMLLIGLVGGLIFCGLLIIIRFWLLLNIPEAIRSPYQFRMTLYYSKIGLGVLIQTGIASIVAMKVKQLGTLYGLFAAFVSGIVMTISLLGSNLLSGGGFDSYTFWLTLCTMTNGGALLALSIVPIVSAIVCRIRKMPSRGSATPS